MAAQSMSAQSPSSFTLAFRRLTRAAIPGNTLVGKFGEQIFVLFEFGACVGQHGRKICGDELR